MNSIVTQPVDFNEDRESTLSDYVEVVKRRRRPFMLIAGLIFTLAIGFAFGLPPIYRSTALVLIEQQDIPTEFVRSTITTYADERIQVLSRKVITEENLLKVIDKHGLYPDAVRERMDPGALAAKLENSISMKMMSAEMLGAASGGKGSKANIAFELSVDYVRDAEAAQKAANELVELFMKENSEERSRKAATTASFLAKEVEHLNKKLEEHESQISAFKGRYAGALPENLASNATIMERLEREITDMERQILTTQQKSLVIEADLAKMPRYLEYPTVENELGEKVMSKDGRLQVLRSELLTLLSKYSTDHPNVQRIRKEMASLGGDPDADGSISLIYGQLSRAEQELDAARKSYTEDHPDVQRLQQQVSSLRSEVGKNRRDMTTGDLGFRKTENPSYMQMQSQVRVNAVEIGSLQSRKTQLSSKLRNLEAMSLKAPTVEREFLELSRQYEQTKKSLDETTKKLRDAQVAETLETEQKGERLTLLGSPEVPKFAYKPNRLSILGIGALLALLAALGGVLLMESMDHSIASPQVFASLVGVHPMGVIPFIVSKSEYEQQVARERLKNVATVMAVVGLILGLILFHFWVTPLDTLWSDWTRALVSKAP